MGALGQVQSRGTKRRGILVARKRATALFRCAVLERSRPAPDLEHGRFFQQAAGSEAIEAEQLRVYDVSRPFENQIRENPAGRILGGESPNRQIGL